MHDINDIETNLGFVNFEHQSPSNAANSLLISISNACFITSVIFPCLAVLYFPLWSSLLYVHPFPSIFSSSCWPLSCCYSFPYLYILILRFLLPLHTLLFTVTLFVLYPSHQKLSCIYFYVSVLVHSMHMCMLLEMYYITISTYSYWISFLQLLTCCLYICTSVCCCCLLCPAYFRLWSLWGRNRLFAEMPTTFPDVR